MESISGDRFNVAMKKAIFLDKAPMNVRVPLQMQNLDNFEAMTAVTLQFLQHNAQYQAGVAVMPNNKKGPDDMKIDALTKKGKSHKNKEKSKTDGQKPSCFVCGRIGHMTKDCWFKDTNKVNTSKDCWFKDTIKGAPPNNKGKKGKGKGKGKGKNSVNEVTESTVTPTGGTTASTSQIARITQDDSLYRIVPMEENDNEEYETGYVLAATRHQPFHQFKDWYAVRLLVDNCADEHVCSPLDFEWIAIEPSRNPNLVSASGHKLKHYGQQAAPMKLRDGRKVWIIFQVFDVNGPIMSVGKFCTKGDDRCATFITNGGILWHEEAGEIAVDRVRNHYELESWIRPRSVVAPVQIGGSSGSTREPQDIVLQFRSEQMQRI